MKFSSARIGAKRGEHPIKTIPKTANSVLTIYLILYCYCNLIVILKKKIYTEQMYRVIVESH